MLVEHEPTTKRPCRSTLPSLKVASAGWSLATARGSKAPVPKSSVWRVSLIATTAPPRSRKAMAPGPDGASQLLRLPSDGANR